MKRRQGRAAANKPKQRRWAVLSRLFRPHAPAIYTRAASGRRSALLSKARNERRHSGRALVTSFSWWRGISAGWWRRPCFLWRSSSWCINSPTSAAGGWRSDCFSTLLEVLRASKVEEVPGCSSCAEVLGWCLRTLGGCLLFVSAVAAADVRQLLPFLHLL